MSWESFWAAPQVQAACVGVIGVSMTVFTTVALEFYRRKREKTSVMTAIRSDVRSLIAAMHEIGLVSAFIETQKSTMPVFPPWVDSPRKEDYFQLYGFVGLHIGRLQPRFARETVKFYTFLKVSRDAAAPLESLRELDPSLRANHHVSHATNVLVALREAFTAAVDILDARWASSKSRRNEGDEVRIARGLLGAIEDALRLQIGAGASTCPR